MKEKTMSRLLRGLSSAVLAVAALQGANAYAAPMLGFNSAGTGPGGYVYSDLYTWLTDSALSVGYLPGTAIPPGAAYSTDLVAQGRIGALQAGGVVNTPAGLNSTYELTFQTRVAETVTSQGTFVAFGGAIHEAATFVLGAGPNLFNLYIDKTVATFANPNVVSGYGEGLGTAAGCAPGAILCGHAVSLTSSFDGVIAGPGAGTGTGSFDLRYLIDGFDAAYIDTTLGGIFGIQATGTLNLPSFFSPTAMWDGTSTAAPNILLKLDGSNSFSAVPEPGSLALLGIGLIGFGLNRFGRRRSQS